jgi:predicted nucleic-acid-binding protein
MKKLIDANVILRYLLKDHPQMSEEARQVIEEGAFTLPEVLAEVVYVLSGVYRIERTEIGRTLTDFLDEISIDNQESVQEALSLFSETSLDFVDCIIIARHRILGEDVMSFDKKLNRML